MGGLGGRRPPENFAFLEANNLTQGVQPNFSEKCGNVGMAMKMWDFFLNVGIIEKM